MLWQKSRAKQPQLKTIAAAPGFRWMVHACSHCWGPDLGKKISAVEKKGKGDWSLGGRQEVGVGGVRQWTVSLPPPALIPSGTPVYWVVLPMFRAPLSLPLDSLWKYHYRHNKINHHNSSCLCALNSSQYNSPANELYIEWFKHVVNVPS